MTWNNIAYTTHNKRLMKIKEAAGGESCRGWQYEKWQSKERGRICILMLIRTMTYNIDPSY